MDWLSRRDAEASAKQEESAASTVECYLTPDADEGDNEFDEKVWSKKAASAKREDLEHGRAWLITWVVIQFPMSGYWLSFLSCILAWWCRNETRKWKLSRIQNAAATSRGPGGPPQRSSAARHSNLVQQSNPTNHSPEQPLPVPPPVANRHAETRTRVGVPTASHRSAAARIDELVANMQPPERGSESQLTCSVCLEGGCEAGKRAVLLPSCKHYFHRSCITDWLNRGDRRCPMCRKPILLGR